MKRTIEPLTSLRFPAALAVVIYHMRDYSLVGLRGGILERGHLAVDFFFVLSGFILAYAHGAEFLAGRGSVRGFIVSRLARIYPAHFAVMVAFVLYVVLLGKAGFAYNTARYTPGTLPLHFLLLEGWGLDNDLTWNFPDWSISAEMAAYLCFPFLIRPVMRLPPSHAFGCLIGLAVLFAILNEPLRLTSRIQDFSVLRIIPEFLMGMLAYRARTALVEVGPVFNAAFGFAASALVAAVLFRMSDAWVVLVFVPLIVAASGLTGRLRAALSVRPLVYCGEASYSLYIVHALVLSVVYKAEQIPAIAARLPGGAADVASLVLAGLGAVVLHQWVETPGRHLIRALLLRRPAALATTPLPAS